MTDIGMDGWVSQAHQPRGFPEFVALVACIMALNPIATDMMLPAMPDVGDAYGITNPGRTKVRSRQRTALAFRSTSTMEACGSAVGVALLPTQHSVQHAPLAF